MNDEGDIKVNDVVLMVKAALGITTRVSQVRQLFVLNLLLSAKETVLGMRIGA